MPILGFLLCGQLTGCFLIPTVAVSDCVCDMGQICTEGNVCQAKPDGEMLDADMKPPCIYNSECDGSVCEYNSADIMANRCLSMDMLVFVGDPSNCNNVTADGTRQNPYCTINKAIDVVTTSGSGQAIRLLADVNYGSLDSSKFTGKSLTIYGPYEPRPNVNPMLANINLSNNTGPAVAVHDPKTIITLDGVVATTDASSSLTGALKCDTGASLNLRRSVIRNAKTWGVYTDGCGMVTVDRTEVIGNIGALSLSLIGPSESLLYSVSNSIIANNHSKNSAHTFVNRGAGQFTHVTVYGNQTTNDKAGAFARDPGAASLVQLISSISTMNTIDYSAGIESQFDPLFAFSFDYVVIGNALGQKAPVRTLGIEPVFVDPISLNFSLVDDRNGLNQNGMCCIGHVTRLPNVAIDLFGRPRKMLTEPGAIAQ